MNSDQKPPIPPQDPSAGKTLNRLDGKLPVESESHESRLVLERSRWFGKRAGMFSDANSASQFLSTLTRTLNGPSNPRETLFVGLAVKALAGAYERGGPNYLLLDLNQTTYPVEEVEDAPEQFGALRPVLKISQLDFPYLILALRANPEEVPDFDLRTAAFIHWRDDSRDLTIVEASEFSAPDNVIVTRITEPGFYQPIALPRHPVAAIILSLVASCLTWNRFGYPTGHSKIAEKLALVEQLVATSIDGAITAPLARFISRLRDNLSSGPPAGIIAPPDPPIIKLWRLQQLEKNSWESLGPFAYQDFISPEKSIQFIGRITQIDTHPFDGDTLIAAASGGGVWRSNQGGLHWYPLTDGLPTLTMGAVAFAPSDPDILYAASGEDAGPCNPAWPGAGVYRSQDCGKSWKLTARVTSTRFSAIVVHPHHPYTLYVAGNKGLHKSLDGGESWLSNPGLLSLFDGRVTDVVIDHAEPDRVYLGASDLGIYRSLSGGESQHGAPAFRLLQDSLLPTGYDAGWIKLAIGRRGEHGSKFLVAKLGRGGERIFTTTDGGEIWQEKTTVIASNINEWTSVIAVDPMDESRLYAGSEFEDLFRSEDGGQHWNRLPTPVFGDQQDIAFDTQNSNRLYLANDGGVYVSDTRGDDWSPASTGLSITQIYDLDISEQDAEVVACGSQDTGVYYRNDSGVWNQNGPADITQVAIDPTDRRIVYCLLAPAGEKELTLLRSEDGGMAFAQQPSILLQEPAPWLPILKLHPDPTLADPKNMREVFLCGRRVIFHSTDSGNTFQVVSSSFGDPLLTDGEISALEYSPSDPSILYLGTSNGVLYKARNGGKQATDWVRLNADFSSSMIMGISIDCQNTEHAWVVVAGNGASRTTRPDASEVEFGEAHAFKTLDGGETWLNGSGLLSTMRLPNVPTSAVVIDSFDRNSVYVGTDVGVYRTSDGGVTWLAFQNGLPRSPVSDLRLNHCQRALYVATMGRGVFRRRLD